LSSLFAPGTDSGLGRPNPDEPELLAPALPTISRE
jgi:hypothetical protein